MAKEILLTPKGFRQLQQEFEELRTVRRREVAELLREARALGDLRENFAYEDAKREQALLEGRIKDLKHVLDIAKVVERPDNQTDIAHLGSTVTLQELDNGEKKVFTLVGSYESDPLQDRISIVSPVGAAIIGRAIGDVVEVETPKGITRYRVESVE